MVAFLSTGRRIHLPFSHHSRIKSSFSVPLICHKSRRIPTNVRTNQRPKKGDLIPAGTFSWMVAFLSTVRRIRLSFQAKREQLKRIYCLICDCLACDCLIHDCLICAIFEQGRFRGWWRFCRRGDASTSPSWVTRRANIRQSRPEYKTVNVRI